MKRAGCKLPAVRQGDKKFSKVKREVMVVKRLVLTNAVIEVRASAPGKGPLHKKKKNRSAKPPVLQLDFSFVFFLFFFCRFLIKKHLVYLNVF